MIKQEDFSKESQEFQEKSFKETITNDKNINLVVFGKDGHTLLTQLEGAPFNPSINGDTLTMIYIFLARNLNEKVGTDPIIVVDLEEDSVAISEREEFLKI